MFRILTLLLIISQSYASSYKLALHPSCPYYCPEDKHRDGYVVDILKSFFKYKKHELQVLKTPYPRIGSTLMKGKADFSVVSSLDSRHEEQLVSYRTQLGFRTTGALFKTSDELVILEFSDLKTKRILLAKGSRATSIISKKIELLNKSESFINEVTGSSIHSRLIELVAIGRGDVVLEDYNILKYNLANSSKRNILTLTPTSLTGHNPISIVASKNSPLRNFFEKDLRDYISSIRKSGKLKEILDRYQITDWDRFTSR